MNIQVAESKKVNKDSLEHKINKQREQIVLLRNNYITLHESLIAGGIVNPFNEINSSLASIGPIEKRFISNSEALVIVFSGMSTRLSMPPAEFLRTFIKKELNLMFVKDFRQCWYQKGLLGISDSIDETIAFFKQEMSKHNFKKIICVGTSAGGYAAILFGTMLNADEILAFSPQSKVNRDIFRNFKSTGSSIKDIDFNSPYLNLSKLPELSSYSGTINLFYGSQNKRDTNHAMNLSQFKSVNLIPLPTDTHATARFLKEEGKLDQIFEEKIRL